MREASDQIVSKSEFAAIAGVGRVRVSQYLAEKKIYGEAIVGRGRKARIRVRVALEQLGRALDVVQHLGANGRARTQGNGDAPRSNGEVPDTVEQSIKAERLRQLALSNAKAVAEEAARSGRYMLADDARQEMGRVASQLMAAFQSALPELATAMAAAFKGVNQRDALRTLRTAWQDIRRRQAKAKWAEAPGVPLILDEHGDANSQSRAGRA
jgi:hypothetical protein